MPPELMLVKPALAKPLKYGVGYNWFDHLGSGGFYARSAGYPLHEPVLPPLSDVASWRAVEEGLNALRPGLIRFGLPPDPHVDAAGNLVAKSVHLDRLEWLNAWAVRNGCTLLLDTFVIPRHYEFPLPPGTQDPGPLYVNMAAADNRAYARNFVLPLLRHVVNDRRLAAVKLFNPVNEPACYGVYQTPPDGPEVWAHYVDMYREMRLALDEAGIPAERIGLVGIDTGANTYPLLDLLARGLNLDPYITGYSIHTYSLRFDYLPPAEGSWTSPINDFINRTCGQVADFCRRRGKEFLFAEMGTFHYGWRHNNSAGAASADAVLTTVEGAIRALNIGAETVAFWSLFNPNNVDGWWRVMGVADGTLVKTMHPWAGYGIFSREARPGSKVHPLAPAADVVLAHRHGTLLHRPDGSWALLLVNDHPYQNQEVELKMPTAVGGRRWNAVITDRARLAAPLPDMIESAAGTLTFTAPAFSFLALTTEP